MKPNFLPCRALLRTSFLLGTFILAFSTPAFSQKKRESKFREVDKLILTQVEENRIPGLAYAVVEGDQLIWSGSAGWADLEAKTPMSTRGIMNIASISKTITATAVMQLWEQGKISLDADINEYLPKPVRNPGHPLVPITIFQLLTHTSSIADGDSYDASYSDGDPVLSLEEWIANYLLPGGRFYDADSNFHTWAPGRNRSYSNVGFGLLGYLVEEVSGQAFNSYCRSHILDPLGMENSGWYLHEIDTSTHIRPYAFHKETDSNERLNLYSFPNYPDGLLRTSVEELSYFLRAIILEGSYRGEGILKQSTLKKMLSVQIKGSGQGLCWDQTRFESMWGHSGGDPGVATYMYFSPRTRIGVIVFQNNHNGDLFRIFRKLYTAAAD